VDGQLAVTHYCAMGNAPEMRLSKSGDKSIAFEAIKANGIDPQKDAHMHGLALSIADKDHLTTTWTSSKSRRSVTDTLVLTWLSSAPRLPFNAFERRWTSSIWKTRPSTPRS